MIQEFVAVDQSTIWDVVNNTYGSVDYIVKLMEDNGFPNVNTYPANGQVFLYGDSLVVDQNTQQTAAGSVKYATRERTTTNDENMKYYEQVLEDQYTSAADGETVIVRTPLIGNRIVQIEKEMKPLYETDFLFNPSTGTITLQNGVTVDNGQTLFILYAIVITS
jgi:hypothetical protein